MTDSKHNPSAGPPPSGSVLDPEWEEVLRRGQTAEGEAGSVEAELAFVHLLRHAREPEALAPDQLDAIWSQIGEELESGTATPWWRKAWVWWSAPALAAAAVLVVVVINPNAKDEATIAQQVDQAAEKTASKPADGSLGEGAGAHDKSAKSAERAPGSAAPTNSAKADDSDPEPARGGSASPFEVSFAKLAPHGRVAIRVSVDQSRDELRSQLLAKARGGGR